MQRSRRGTLSDGFFARINCCRAEIGLALEKELRQRQNSPFYAPLKDALVGGKRLRAIIVLLACDSVGGQGGDPLPAAVAIELAHMESLIHDDIIDGDDVRRNAKAFHSLYGQEMALLSADFILSLILGITARYEDSRITSALAKAAACMCEGELIERYVGQTKKTLPVDQYQSIVSKKTAALFEAAATLGALIGEGTPDEVSSLADYAHALGVAYQVHDDIVDWGLSRASVLDLIGTRYSQDECLQKLMAIHVSEAVRSLHGLKSSESKEYLIQLAKCIKSNQIDHV
jgi:octaprenyl-diphosphate synthase